MMIHEFGKQGNKTVLLIHPVEVMWDYFNFVILKLKDRYHLIAPHCLAMAGKILKKTIQASNRLQRCWTAAECVQ